MRNWIDGKFWVAYFDLLGFKSKINVPCDSNGFKVLQIAIDRTLDRLRNESAKGNVNILSYADTFIIYSDTELINHALHFFVTAEKFIDDCIKEKLPVRGAISYGEISYREEYSIMIGEALCESHAYGEDQNWLGLILAPSASAKFEVQGVRPEKWGFTKYSIPFRKYKKLDDSSSYAYRFCGANDGIFKGFELPLARFEEMKLRAPDDEKVKYENTIRFINECSPKE